MLILAACFITAYAPKHLKIQCRQGREGATARERTRRELWLNKSEWRTRRMNERRGKKRQQRTMEYTTVSVIDVAHNRHMCLKVASRNPLPYNYICLCWALMNWSLQSKSCRHILHAIMNMGFDGIPILVEYCYFSGKVKRQTTETALFQAISKKKQPL